MASHDVIGHVIILLAIQGFAISGQFEATPHISHGYRDIEPQRFRCHDLDVWGHVTSPVT